MKCRSICLVFILELPEGWGYYPGRFISDSALDLKARTGDRCVNLCNSNPACAAIDYDTSSGTCWLHVQKDACKPLSAHALIYHAKKKAVCGKNVTLYKK